MKAFFYDLWDRLLLSLPLLIMGVLALGTYWMARSTPDQAALEPERSASHEPDYFMHAFSVKTFDATGKLRTEVSGDVARHYPDTQWMEIDAIRIRSFDTNGRLTTATALKGLTNEDSSEVQLLGQANVVREAQTQGSAITPRMEYRGEFLHAFLNTEQVRSHKPVELIRGNDRITADSLDFDNIEQVMQLRGRVRGILVPDAAQP